MDVYLILGGEDEESRPRCNAFINHVRKKLEVNPRYFEEMRVVCSGNRSLTNKPRVAESISMREYLVSRGIADSSIACEVESRDTLGNLIFSYPIIMALNPTNILLVTEGFHMKRAANIFKAIFGKFPDELVAAKNSPLIFSKHRLEFWKHLTHLSTNEIDSSFWQELAISISSVSTPSVREYFILLAQEWDIMEYKINSYESAKKYIYSLPIYGKDTLKNSAYATLMRTLVAK